jgi:hypothetical protein
LHGQQKLRMSAHREGDRRGSSDHPFWPDRGRQNSGFKRADRTLTGPPLAYIDGDQFWSFLVKRAEGDRREDFRAIMRAMTSAAGSFTRTGYDVLLDFSIPPPFLPTARRILRDAPLDYVVLRPPLEICEARARDRAEGRIANYDRGFYALFAADARAYGGAGQGRKPEGHRRDYFRGSQGGPLPGRAVGLIAFTD